MTTRPALTSSPVTGRRRRLARAAVVGMSTMLAVSMAAGVAIAAPVRSRQPVGYHPPKPQMDWVTPGHTEVAPKTAGTFSPSVISRIPRYAPGAPTWPAAGVFAAGATTATGSRAAGSTVDGGATTVRFPGTPVSVASADAAEALATRPGGPVAAVLPDRVHVFSHAEALAAGVNGVVVALGVTAGPAAAAGVRSPVRVTVTYKGFAGAYGADWATRLRLSVLPPCALTTPGLAACRATPVPTHNDLPAGTVSAQVSGAAMVALDAGPSGGAGDYSATTLSPSGTWSAGDSSGNFSWNYPMRSPPGLNGPVPNLAISYSSASVDGQMAASNNQPSWLGEGFNLTPGGYIERSYRTCGADMGGGANNTTNTGDQCWAGDNATLSLGSHAGDLLVDPTNPNRWHLRQDDGTYISHRTANTGNGDNDGEWWVVTTSDGVQYWFGGVNTSNSTQLVPVAGNNPGEPCHATTFIASFCVQAYRWNLDRVVDRLGNTMTYVYTKETNLYARNMTPSDVVSYDRAAYLTRIDYATRTDTTGQAPVSVAFTTADRCLSGCTTHDAAHWPDTPWDQACTGSPCNIGTPTFWTTRRLTSVTTQLWSGTGSTYNPVTTWAFGQSFLDPADGTRAGLVLNSISQTGYEGVTTAMPDMTFAYVQLANRVDGTVTPDGLPPMNWARVAQIMTETGERIEVTYAPQDCVAGTARMPDPNNLQNNTLRCYPVKWQPPGFAAPIIDFFHKYVVQEVHEVDTVTPNNPTTVVSYQYLGTPAWHYTDDNGLVKPADKTWSVWRGYGDVVTTTGVGAAQTSTETLYYRGMNGDYRPGGNLVATLPAVDMNANGVASDPVDVPAAADEDAFAGQIRTKIVTNGSNPLSTQVSVAWQSDPTATRTANGVTVNARFINVAQVHTSIALDGGRAPRTTSLTRQFDGYGMEVSESDLGDEAVGGDERCTLTDYNRNLDTATGNSWLLSLGSRHRVFSTDCAHVDLGHIDPATIVADDQNYYDNAGSLTTPPTVGLVTRQDAVTTYTAGVPSYGTAATATYDSYGRATSSTDARGDTATMSYTENAGGQQVSVSQTNSLGWAPTVIVQDPAFGSPLTTTDTNGRVTTEQYDGLGRLVKEWGPGRDTTQTPNVAYTYTLRNDGVSAVTTTRLTATGTITSYVLYDGLLRPRQTQQPRGDGLAGTILTDTFYDAAGRGWKTYQPYLASVIPGPNLFVPNEQGDVPSRTEQQFDAAGRVTDTITYVRDGTGLPTVFAATHVGYGGDRTDQTPPAGGIATSTYADARGNMTALRQYHGATPTPDVAGSYDQATYRYDAGGRLTQVTDPAGNVWTRTYNMRGDLTDTVDPDRGHTHYVYTAAGDLTSVTDSRGGTLSYTYDVLGRKTGLYNGAVAPANKIAEWDYDGLTNSRGHLTKSIRYAGSDAYVKEITGFTATYEATGVRYTIPASETGLAGTYSYVYTYLPDGSQQSERLPDVDGTGGLARETVTTSYNALGRFAGLSSSLDSGTNYVSAVGYTGYGETATTTLQYRTNPATTVSRIYAAGTRRLSELLVSRAAAPTTLSDLRFTYDTAGETTGIADTATGDYQCFAYDHAQRLTDAWTPATNDCATAPSAATLGGPAPYRDHWSFDTAGNRAEQIQYGTATGDRTTDYHYDAVQPHSLDSTTTTDTTGTTSASYGYDTNGNTLQRPAGAGTQALTWDPEGAVTQSTDSTGVTSYVYDADGERLIRRDPTGKTLYLPDQELRYTTAGGTKSCTRYYSAAGRPVAMRTTAGVSWLSGDAQGTVGLTINATTQAYAVRRQDPYGNPRGSVSGTWPTGMDKGFLGGTNDNTGLTHLGVREYDPVIGRFTSPDPVLHPDILGHFDTYAYGLHNPFGFPDPTGADPANPYAGGQYYQIGTPITGTINFFGVIIQYRIDYYIMCRDGSGGAECVGRFTQPNGTVQEYWVPAWQLLRAILLHTPGVGFKVFEFWQLRATGNVAGPRTPLGAPVKTATKGCLQIVVPPPTARKSCPFFSLDCDFFDWWDHNSRWVEGTASLAALIVCVATDGAACAIAGDIASGMSIAGSTVDAYNQSLTDASATQVIAEFLTGALWDRFGDRIFEGHRALKLAYMAVDTLDKYGVITADPKEIIFKDPESGTETKLFTGLTFIQEFPAQQNATPRH